MKLLINHRNFAFIDAASLLRLRHILKTAVDLIDIDMITQIKKIILGSYPENQRGAIIIDICHIKGKRFLSSVECLWFHAHPFFCLLTVDNQLLRCPGIASQSIQPVLKHWQTRGSDSTACQYQTGSNRQQRLIRHPFSPAADLLPFIHLHTNLL